MPESEQVPLRAPPGQPLPTLKPAAGGPRTPLLCRGERLPRDGSPARTADPVCSSCVEKNLGGASSARTVQPARANLPVPGPPGSGFQAMHVNSITIKVIGSTCTPMARRQQWPRLWLTRLSVAAASFSPLLRQPAQLPRPLCGRRNGCSARMIVAEAGQAHCGTSACS